MRYCRNCGQPLPEEGGACTACGCPVGMGIGYCEKCGEKLIPGTMYCARCGAPAGMVSPQPPARKPRHRLTAALYGIVLGSYGVHNFYLGYTGKGIGQIAITVVVYSAALSGALPGIASVLLAGLWGFIEGVQILTGEIHTDANGIPLKEWKKDEEK